MQKLITLFLEFISQNETLIKLSNSGFQIEKFQGQFSESYNEYLSGNKKEFQKEFSHIFFIHTISNDQNLFCEDTVSSKTELLKRWLTYQVSDFIDFQEIKKVINFLKINYMNKIEKNVSIIEFFVFVLSYKNLLTVTSEYPQNSDSKAVLKYMEKEYFYPLVKNIAEKQLKGSDSQSIIDNEILEPLFNSFRKQLRDLSVHDILIRFNRNYWSGAVKNEIIRPFSKKSKNEIQEISFDTPIGDNQEKTLGDFLPADKKQESEEIFDNKYSPNIFKKTIYEIMVDNDEDNTKKIGYLFLFSVLSENQMVADSLGASKATITNISNSVKIDFSYLLNMTVNEYLRDILKVSEKVKIVEDFYYKELDETFDKEELVLKLNEEMKSFDLKIENIEGIVKILQAIKIREYIRGLSKEFGIETKTFRNEIILEMQDSNPKIWKSSLIMEKELTGRVKVKGIDLNSDRIKDISKKFHTLGKDITRVIYDDKNIIDINDSEAFYKDFQFYIKNKLDPANNIDIRNLFSKKSLFENNVSKTKNRILFNFFLSFKYEKNSDFELTSDIKIYPFRVFDCLEVNKESKYVPANSEYLKDEICLEIKDIILIET